MESVVAERTVGGGGNTFEGWKDDYNKALKAEEEYSKRAKAMDAEVKAAKNAYYAAPTRSKKQKEEAAQLEQEMNRLTREQSMLQYRAAQFATLADNIRMQNDKRYRNKKEKEARARLRREYR